ncbi:unnamed protein product [Ectocarpus sp. 13 AM-2016]
MRDIVLACATLYAWGHGDRIFDALRFEELKKLGQLSTMKERGLILDGHFEVRREMLMLAVSASRRHAGRPNLGAEKSRTRLMGNIGYHHQRSPFAVIAASCWHTRSAVYM